MGDLQDSNKTTSLDESLIVIADGAGGGSQAAVITRTNSSKGLATESEIAGSDVGGTYRKVSTKLRTDGSTALVTEASVVLAGGTTQSYTSKLRYDDMNTTTGTLARGASVTAASGWNKVYGYTGSGLLSGCVISLETKDYWAVRIVVDGEEIFGTGTGNGILSTDLHTDSIYDSDTSGRSVPELDQDLGVFWGAHDRFQWVGPLLIPVTYLSSINIYIRRAVGSATKKFQAGFVVIEKRT